MYGVRRAEGDSPIAATYPKFASEGSARFLAAFHSNLTDTHWRDCKNFQLAEKFFRLLVRGDSFPP